MAKSADLGYASGGAVSQDGILAISECKRCGEQIVWATSSRTGKHYPVTVSRGYLGQRFYVNSDIHKCDEVLAKREAAVESAKGAQASKDYMGLIQERGAWCRENGIDTKDDPEITRLFAEWEAVTGKPE